MVYKVGQRIQFKSCGPAHEPCQACDCSAECTHQKRDQLWYDATILYVSYDYLRVGVDGAKGYSSDNVTMNAKEGVNVRLLNPRIERMCNA